MNASGTFLPPTREVRAVIEGLQTQVPGTITAATIGKRALLRPVPRPDPGIHLP